MADITGMQPAGKVLPIWRGDYNNSAYYEQTDIVLYNNSSYIAKQDTVGNSPPEPADNANDYWQLVAKGIVDADISDATVEFEDTKKRENIESGEETKTLFSKIKRWFADLKEVAFTGSYSDLSNKPTIPAAVAVKGNAESQYRTGNVNLTPANIGAVATSKVLSTKEQINANTDTANVAGATAVKAMVSEINSNIQSANDELSQKSTSIINSINYMSDLKRTYQLKPNKAYLVTVFAYSFDNVDAIMNTGAFFVYTPYSNGANGAIREIYDSGHVTLSVDSNCLLSIEGTYRYMHYSITQL